MKQLALALVLLTLVACVTTRTGPPPREVEPEQAALTNLRLGSEYLQRGDRERALEKLLRAVEQDPDLGAAHAYLGLTYEQLGQPAEADKHYRAAVRLDGNDPAVQNMYAVYLCRHDRITQAEKHFLAAIKIPTYATPETAYTNAGVCALKIPDPERAERYFREALALNPRYADALWQMARLAHNAGRDFQARAFLQRLADVAQLPPAALWLGVQVEHRLGDERVARRYGQELLERFPESVEAQQYHERFGS